MSNLIKPTAASLKNEEQTLLILLRLYEAVTGLVQAAARTAVIDLGARTDDPGVPPTGVVYLYTIGGALYARTAIAPYLLAL